MVIIFQATPKQQKLCLIQLVSPTANARKLKTTTKNTRVINNIRYSIYLLSSFLFFNLALSFYTFRPFNRLFQSFRKEREGLGRD